MIMNVVLLIWDKVCFILGISGNVFVLYATVAHKAIKLDTMSTWIIKNLAVVDMCNCVFIVIPDIAVQYEDDKWVFGAHLCYLYAINQYTFMIANIVLINLFSFNRLFRCKYPLRNINPTRFQRVTVPLLTLLICSSVMLWTTIGIEKDFRVIPLFDDGENLFSIPKTFICTAMTVQEKINLSYRILALLLPIFGGIFCLTLVITTTVLLVYAVKNTNRPINKKNIFTVIIVTISFLLSFFPSCAVSVMFKFMRVTSTTYDASWSLTFLASWINPVIYVVMNESFRQFTKQRIYIWVHRSQVDAQQQPST